MPRGASNNVRAGSFVLASIGLAFVSILALSTLTQRLHAREVYTVRFPLALGASGVEAGSLVMVGGRSVGTVEEIVLRTQREREIPPSVDCVIKVDAAVRFFGSPVAFLERPLLGAGATLNFTNLGDAATQPPLAPGSVMRGDVAAPSFLTQAGYGEEQKGQLQDILRRGKEIADDIREAARDIREHIAPDARAVIADIRERSPQWFDRVDNVTSNADEFGKRLPGIGEDAREIAAKIRATIDENRERFDRIIANVDSATKHFDADTLPLIDGLMREGRVTVAEARTAVDRVNSFFVEEEPGLRKSLANARLASDQLRLTLAEVRRSPWRLLYRPDAKEMEFELLYDSARTYADAVSDLRAASDSLRAAQAAPDAADAAQIRLLLENVERSFNTYRKAESRFLDLVIERGGGKQPPG